MPTLRIVRWVGLALVVSVAGACSAGAGAVERGSGDFEGVTLVEPATGDVFDGSVRVQIDTGSIDTSGETVPYDYGGRFHLLVDRGCVDTGEALPIGEPGHHVFEDGADALSVDLPTGAHELCVQFGNVFDLAYYSYDEAVIRVE
jgi:hypothetical protein